MFRFFKTWILAGLLILLAACATFYQKTQQIQTQIARGNFVQADKMLDKEEKWADNNHRVLYFMNRGMVSYMLGNYQQSIEYLNQADFYIEDYKKSWGSEALALISNPMAKPYRPEDFEAIMVNFYKALAFLEMDNMEAALVEARRVNIRLQQLNDKYKDHKNKYQRDAFAHSLMGMIYEAAHDHNNAFIAYRNALEVYENDYVELFGLQAPHQLKEDLMRAARKTGFDDEMRLYSEKFNMEPPPVKNDSTGSLVFIWLNGMGPVKWEWDLGITNFGINNGFLILGNRDLGLHFPLYVGNHSDQQIAAFKNLSFLRIAFPRYVERVPLFSGATLQTSRGQYPLEKAQDINQIAFRSLRDRMVREVGNSLLRLATKRAMEEMARSQNDNFGTILSIVNAMTEKADTRNWQSLPHSVYYTRISLPPGQHTLDLHLEGATQGTRTLKVEIQPGQTTFYTHHTLDSQ